MDFDGSRLRMRRAGQQRHLPAVVLEAGAGAGSACWGWVQRRLAARTLVLSYDRAGLGASDVMAEDVGADATAARLNALLAGSGICPPYILVGHSLGGAYVQYYAARHAASTAGLVLVDPTPSAPSLVPPRSYGATAFYFLLLRLLQALAWTGAFRIYNPFRLIAKRLRLPAAEKEDVIAAFASPRHLGTVIRELKAIESVRRAVHAFPPPAHIPILVVTAGTRSGRRARTRAAVAQFYERVMECHRAIAARSTAGLHVVIEKANHNSLLSERAFAEELADNILRFAEQCRPIGPHAEAGESRSSTPG